MFNIDYGNFEVNFNPTNSQCFNADLQVYLPAENGVPPGGETNSILTKLSNEDYDTGWVLPADQVLQDDNRPVISSAVYAKIVESVNSIMALCAPIYYNSQETWDLQRDLITQRRAVYVYYNHTYIVDNNNVRHAVPAIKIGDDTSYLIDMPFVNEDVVIQLADHINNTVIHVTGADKEFWNNKVTCYMDSQNDELLVFSKTD